MASLYPDEGLDFLLDLIRRGSMFPPTLYLGFFTSHSPSTVPARDAILNTQTGVTEAQGAGYDRAAVHATAWGPPTTQGTGRRITALSPIQVGPVGAGGWGTLHGFFLATMPVRGSAIYYANFDDLSAYSPSQNDVLYVTPYMEFRG